MIGLVVDRLKIKTHNVIKDNIMCLTSKKILLLLLLLYLN